MAEMFVDDDRVTETGQQALLAALRLTLAKSVEPEHLLIALCEGDSSPLSQECVRLRPALDPTGLKDTLVGAVKSSIGQPFSGEWSESLLGQRTKDLLASLRGSSEWTAGSPEIRQRLLAADALAAAKPRIRNVFSHAGVNVDDLGNALRNAPVETGAAPEVFLATGDLNKDAFDGAARGVLRLVETEGKGLGLLRVNTPLLLFALVSRENGLLERCLRIQNANPRALHQNLTMHLRALGKGRLNESFALRRDAMPSAVALVFERAAQLAHKAGQPAVGEVDLIRSLLIESDPFVNSCLTTLKVDLKAMSEFVAQRPPAEDEKPDEKKLPPIEEVEKRLRSRVVGQGHVIDSVMPILKRLRFGYTRRGRPMGVLLFLGASGTGKTQLAKEMARTVYGSEDQLIFLEMGQFGTEHSKTMFIGAPPGLVGYGEGLLTNGLRDKPESVVLFDEVEKAHKSVFDVLLRFLDEGQIADPAGPVRDGSKCIIILTSNHALDVLRPVIERQTKTKTLTPDQREQIRSEVRSAVLQTEFFRPEFLNRVDDILLFNTFNEDAYSQIIRGQIAEECRRLKEEKDLEITVDEDLIENLIAQCASRSDEGARVCGKLVGNLVVGPIIDFFVQEGNRSVRAARVQQSEKAGGVEVVREVRRD